MIPYKTMLLVHPKNYPKSKRWVANRYMFLNQVIRTHTDLAYGRGLDKEIVWIETNAQECAYMGLKRSIDTVSLDIPERKEKLNYFEIREVKVKDDTGKTSQHNTEVHEGAG